MNSCLSFQRRIKPCFHFSGQCERDFNAREREKKGVLSKRSANKKKTKYNK